MVNNKDSGDRGVSPMSRAGAAGRVWARRVVSWQTALAAGALALAVSAVWLTLRADFLAHPGWLAAQKADLILGPVLVGLYWLRVRPASRFGWLLIAYGILCAGYIAQSSRTPWLFGTGLLWESLIFLGNLYLILSFPTGRLDGIVAKLVLAGGTFVAALNVFLILLLPQTGAGGAISGCRASCPENGVAVTSDVALVADLLDPFQLAVIAVALATIGLLIQRMITGTPPQRRALAIGTPVALVFLVLQVVYLTLSVLDVDAPRVQEVAQWGFTAARSAVWYGFVFALIAAQLFAGRALRKLVRQSVQRPSQPELEAMLREPLGDPGLRLRFWDPRVDGWDGPLEPGPGYTVTTVERAGAPEVALIHDAQLDDDPELVQAAGAVALLAAENAELDRAGNDALEDLRRSRARMSRAVDDERRRFATDLHDGVQQRLIAVVFRLASSAEMTSEAALRARLEDIGKSVEVAVDELRDLARGLYPHLLIERGLISALEEAIRPLPVEHNSIGRHPPAVESAIYYCCLEAIHNATKHGGPDVHVTVGVHEDAEVLRFEVTDDGIGFDPMEPRDGMGLESMRARLGAVDGRLSLVSETGRGTVVSGSIPLHHSGITGRAQRGRR